MGKKYYLLDAKDKPLGRISTVAASLLRGKNNPNFAPNIISNNIVIIINANSVYLTGTKELSKCYYHHSGFHGGIKEISFSELKKKNPKEIIQKSIYGMLPKNRLTKEILKNLKIFDDNNHSFEKEMINPVKE